MSPHSLKRSRAEGMKSEKKLLNFWAAFNPQISSYLSIFQISLFSYVSFMYHYLSLNINHKNLSIFSYVILRNLCLDIQLSLYQKLNLWAAFYPQISSYLSIQIDIYLQLCKPMIFINIYFQRESKGKRHWTMEIEIHLQ